MITFSEIFVNPILTGEKTETRRLGKKRWKVGSVHKAVTNRWKDTTFARIQILEVEEERIGNISEESAHLEGFDSRDSFLKIFYQLNKHKLPQLGWQDEYCWRIRFKVVA